MTDVALLRPDRQFVEAVVASGGGDLKKCFQCATCSVVCELADGRSMFPRKEMIWAQWGLKDRLLADPDVWLCYQCDDCSKRCPRGARPGDVLAAVRQQAIRHYAVPRALARWVNQVRSLPLLLLVPVALLALALAARAPLERLLALGGGAPERGFYAAFFPHWLLIGFFSLFTGLTLLACAAGVVRLWRAMRAADAEAGAGPPALGLARSLLLAAGEILGHARFGKCGRRAPRRWTHLLAFYGFTALLVVTVWAVADLYVFPLFGVPSAYPFGQLHPMKILANVGAVLLIVGGVKALLDRRGAVAESGASTAFDWLFVWGLVAVGVTGVLTELIRLLAEPAARGALTNVAYGVYLVHLALVFQLLVYLPYSKFAHVIYRTAAIVYAEHTGRLRPAFQLQPSPRA
jgi:quinone-modifying oxidoreductase subunit QmoC